MAARTTSKVDKTTALHTGTNRLGVAGLADPTGNDWIVMNDAAVAEGGVINALVVATAATGSAVTVTAGGANPDTNAGVTIYGRGTGVTTIGSDSSPVTLASAVTVSSGMTVTTTFTASSNATITGTLTSSNINSSGAILATGTITAKDVSTSSEAIGIRFGSSSTYKRPAIYYGSSIPSVVAPAPGSLFVFTGGTSSNALMVAGPNAGAGSSSNWYTVNLIAL